MVRHALERGCEVVGVCRERSIDKLEEFSDRVDIEPGQTDDREVVARAVAGCDAVLTVLVPFGMNGYASGTAQAVLPPRLADQAFVAGDYSIADIACFCWSRSARWSGVDIDDLVNLARWHDDIGRRPAVARGLTVPDKIDPKSVDPAAVIDKARNMLA